MKDKYGTEIKYCDILINPFARDLWIVYRMNGVATLSMVPSSGSIAHPPEKRMGFCEMPLSEVKDFFVVIGGVQLDPNSIPSEEIPEEEIPPTEEVPPAAE
jgi:hypothetical protein